MIRYVQLRAALVFEALVIDLDGDFFLEVLVLKHDVDLDLALIVLIAHPVIIVIDYFLQIVLLYALQLSQELLELFLTLIK